MSEWWELCLHCKERPPVATLPEYKMPVPDQYKSDAALLCDPCQRTADEWLTDEVYAMEFPQWAVLADE